MTHALTFHPLAYTAENDVGFIAITENTANAWWSNSVHPHMHDEESIKRILTAKNAEPVAVLKGDELLSWLSK
jgi:hypothetical protein